MPVIPFPPQPLPPEPPPSRPRVPAVPSRWAFPATAASVRRARRAVAGALPADCVPRLADGLVLLASELVTNAVRHGTLREDREEQLVELFLWFADGHYWLAVSDPGDGRPALRTAGPDSCGGRGLVLVDAVSAAWAVVPRRPCAKSVVAGMPLHGG